MHKKEYFVSGIDTNCGKTYITGMLANELKKSGINVITAKFVQTGCVGIAEDILEHRRLMNSELMPEDCSGLTCPFVYSFPASPHLAAAIDNKPLDLNIIKQSTKQLFQNYDLVLTEGAGGLMVPLTESYLTIDYIRDNRLPVILVASSKLGSINHTLLSIEMSLQYNLKLHAVIYNKMPSDDPQIADSSYTYIKNYLTEKSPATLLLHSEQMEDWDVGKIF